MKKHFLGILFLLICCTNHLAAQVDTEFWFAAPHISEHSRVTGVYHIILFAYDQSAHVVISMPANTSFVDKVYDLQPHESVDVIMASDYDDAAANFEVPFNVVSQRGIHITSTAKIGGYYQHAGNNSEAFSFKKNAPGTDFLVTSQISYLTQNNDSYVDAYSSIQIVATEDNTIVRITPLTGHQLGTTCSNNQVVINLNRGETYAIRSCSKDPAYGINGTHITSNKAIAVTSTDDSTHPVEDFNVGLDLTGEQLVPTSLAGTEYIVVGEQKEWSVCYVTALENGTTVNLGNGTSFSLQQYQTRTISMSAIKALYISSNKPIIVYQITGEDDEAAGTVLPTLACTGSSYAAYKKLPNSFKAIFNIVVKAADIDKISINGTHLASSNFHTIPGTTLWYYASVDLVSYSSDVIKIQSDGGLFQLGALDMIGTSMTKLKSCSYGYFSDYGTAHEYDEYDLFTEGTTYTWKNHFLPGTTTPMTFTEEGIYTDHLSDANGCDSICILHLSKIPYPDNVADVECVVPPIPSDFEMKELYQAQEAISVSTPFVADIDGDGQTEIIASSWVGGSPKFHANRINIYDGRNGTLERSITTPVYNLCGQPLAIADVDRDGKGEIFLLASDMYIYAYNWQGIQIWKSSFTLSDRFMPALADVNNDGQPELVCGKYIFKPTDGTLLLELTLNPDGMGFGAPNGIASTKGYYSYYMPALTDIDCDGSLELCAGTTIYKLNILNPNGASGNSFSVLRTANTIGAYTDWNYDGQTFVVDFDNDGDEDICVIGCNHDVTDNGSPYYIDLYIWDGQTSNIIGYARETSLGHNNGGTWCAASMPFAGDLNGDGFPEILFSMYETAMFAYTYDNSQPNGTRRMHKHVPFAETVGFTVFDFNMDGKSEIVYRGMDELFVADGTTLNYLCTPISIHSQTLTEYPVVADVNGDGVAEIIIANSSDRTVYVGWMSVFGEAKSGAWSSARPVWNQWAYNSVNINEDLTVPQNQYNVATLFPNGKRPYNTFLSQVPIINKQGDIFVPAADAAVTSCTSEVINDSVNITISFCNNGDANLIAPYEIAVYQNEYRGRVVQVDTIKETLPISGCKTATIKVPALSFCQAAVDNTFVIAVNDDGHGIAQHGNQQAECDTTNNRTSIVLPPNLRRDTTHVSIIIDQGETYPFNGHVYSTDTKDTATFTAASGCDSVCILDLKVIPYPDNVEVVNCSAPLENNDWTIKTSYSSEEIMSPLVIPLVGDINDDGVNEILCFAPNSTHKYFGATQINIINGVTHNIIDQININGVVPTESAGIYGIVKLPNRHTILVVVITGKKILGYDLCASHTSPIWTKSIPYNMVNINFADFNNDGYPEVYCGNYIFDVETGNLLAHGGTNSGKSFAHKNETGLSLSTDDYMHAPFAADMDEDGKLELVAGNEIYKVSITNRTGESGNSISLLKSITPPTGVPADGHTQVADFNLDGHLDVLISNKPQTTNTNVYYYVWDVYNNTTSQPIIIPNVDGVERGKSFPLIADINADGELEIIVQSDTYHNYDKVQAYKYNIAGNNFTHLWNLTVDEDSYSNTMSAFDFNHDGINELILTDQTTIKILNGSGKSHITGNDTVNIYAMSSFSFGECTIMQYPVVVDVDKDGTADIVAIGRYGSGHTYKGSLNIFTSAGKPWAPARSVWNQYMYNVFNINEDLTIPTYHYSNAKSFTDPDDPTIIRRPYNNFFQQSTTIDQYGRYVNRAADVAVTSVTQAHTELEWSLTPSYCNNGERELLAPYKITIYANSYHGDVIATETVNQTLPVGDCVQPTLQIPSSVLCADSTIHKLVIVVNDGGLGVAQHGNQQAECDTTNNILSITIPNIHTDTTRFASVICASELPYTHTESGITFPIGFSNTDSCITKPNRFGCDSVVQVKITINPTLYGDTSATFCKGHPFKWHGVDYSTAGNYPYTYTSKVTGCDSIVTLHLTQLEPTDSVEVVTICAGASHIWHGNPYTTTTTTTEILTNAAGCDSVCTLQLTVLPELKGDTSATFCNGHPFKWHGVDYPTGGDYPYTYTSKVTGCDSIVTLHLTQLEPTDSIENVTICEGETHYWHGSPYTSTTDITETITNAVGCDSVCTLHLKVIPKLTGDTSATFCNGHPFKWHGVDYSTAGDYPYTYTSKVTGCDSVVTLHLTQLEPTDSIEYATICEGDTYTWHGHTYTSSTDITETIDNAVGCDSVFTLHLTVNPKLYGDTAMTVCDTLLPVVWRGQTISSAGPYYHTLTGSNGCDSIVTLTVTVETCLPPVPPTPTCDTLQATLIVPDICADDDSMYIDITYTDGLPVTYSVTFGSDAVAQGFQASYSGNVRITSATTATIAIAIPNDPNDRQKYPRPNTYKINISLTDTCDATQTWSEEFLIHYPSWLTLQRWNDVISMYNERYNGGYVFSTIRWYHEGSLLESHGDHDGYIYERPHLIYGEAYWAELTRADDGVTITTCPIYPVPMTDSTNMDNVTDPYIIVTPTVVPAADPYVTVKTNICGEYYMYYVDGRLLDKQSFCPPAGNTFRIDIGMHYVRTGQYILIFYGEEGTIKAVKLLLEPLY